jgi:hypothetical protein
MSKLAETLLEKLEHSEDWTIGEYTAKHNPSGLELWIANGFWFVNVRNTRINLFSPWDKFRLFRAVERALNEKLINQLNKDAK